MNDTYQIEALKKRIQELEEENKRLKYLLSQYDQIPKELHADRPQILPIVINKKTVKRFYYYFRGRPDVFAKRYENESTGAFGYYPQCDHFYIKGICPKRSGKKVACTQCPNQKWTPLTFQHYHDHLKGENNNGSFVMGVYPLYAQGICTFLVFDFDYHDKDRKAEQKDYANINNRWIGEVDALRKICKIHDIPCIVERSRSGKGAHLWIFFDGGIDAALARRFGFMLLEIGAESVNLTSFKFYDRMLPAQDYLKDDRSIGNLIALPLQRQALKEGNSAFVDEKWQVYPNQMRTLFSTKRLSKDDLEAFINKWSEKTPDLGRPWERKNSFYKEDVEGIVSIVRAQRLYIDTRNLKPRLANTIRRLACISNPQFFRNIKSGQSNYGVSRYIYLGDDDQGYICLPRGNYKTLIENLEDAKISYHVDDQRSIGKHFDITFIGTLKDIQEEALKTLTSYDDGILSGATAFGKTVTSMALIAKMRTSTLILLNHKELIKQWESSVAEFLQINEPLPTYQTKTGRVKTRTSHVGLILSNKDTSNGIIDIAMVGSLYKKGQPHPRLEDYGLIIVDECHHAASETMKKVLLDVKARYVYGVTATPFRGDQLNEINFMLLGPVRYRYTSKQQALEQSFEHYVIPRFTRVVHPLGKGKLSLHEANIYIKDSVIRNEQIIEDVKTCILNKRTPLILTKRVDHVSMLYEALKEEADHVFMLSGTLSKSQQEEVLKMMKQVRDEETLILLATGQMVGEGFDFPRLDTLILAMPISFKGIVEQYTGRINRDYPGKSSAIVYDYIDIHIPVFESMYLKRLKGYKRIGYQVMTSMTNHQEAGFIYDFDSYEEVYSSDLKNASKYIIISSPFLSKAKIMKTLSLLKEVQERGVRVIAVTWHVDAYMYEETTHHAASIDLLRRNGIDVILQEEQCERFALIDDSLVWYGSMNLLSDDKLEDTMIRLKSKEIAAELLLNTFNKDHPYDLYDN